MLGFIFCFASHISFSRLACLPPDSSVLGTSGIDIQLTSVKATYLPANVLSMCSRCIQEPDSTVSRYIFPKLKQYVCVWRFLAFSVSFFNRSSHTEEKKSLQYEILDKFTKEDGSTPLYVSREPLFSAPSAWPIPHDAPYQDHLNRWMIATLEVCLVDSLIII